MSELTSNEHRTGIGTLLSLSKFTDFLLDCEASTFVTHRKENVLCDQSDEEEREEGAFGFLL